MPTFSGIQALPPVSWEEFEEITCSAVKNRWGTQEFTRYGRQGQLQDGVDIYGDAPGIGLAGIQCKNLKGRLTIEMVRAEIEKAQSFKPVLDHYYVATTAETDAGLQKAVMELSEKRAESGQFKVTVLFWNDIWQDLAREESSVFQHYPQLRPQPTVQEPSHDLRLFREFLDLLPFNPYMRFFKDHDFGDSFSRDYVHPLYHFYELWRDDPEKEFIDAELQGALSVFHAAAKQMSDHLAHKTVPVRGGFLSVFPDSLRELGGRPQHVLDDAKTLNEEAPLFLSKYLEFVRFCKSKLVS